MYQDFVMLITGFVEVKRNPQVQQATTQFYDERDEFDFQLYFLNILNNVHTINKRIKSKDPSL